MSRFLSFLCVVALLGGLAAVPTVCMTGCAVNDYYVPPRPPVPPPPPDPDPTPTPTPQDPSWPPSDLPRYGADVWEQVEEGMTKAEVVEIMPVYWLHSDSGDLRSYVYLTDESHSNGFPKVFVVRYPKEPNDDTVKVKETSGKPY